MFAYLRGTVQLKQMISGPCDRLVIDVGGIGYEMAVCRRTLLTVAEPGQESTVHTALSIRENDWTLFGFSTEAEREIFGLLQSVSGVGPKLALALVGTLNPSELTQAILSENQKLLSQAPGVGLKVAQRLILELKSKVEDFNNRRGITMPTSTKFQGTVFEEVRAVLDSLGYTPTEVNLALKKAEEEHLEQDVELLVRHSLRVLGAAVTRK